MIKREVLTDCIYFNGYKPCTSHKLRGSVCENCKDYNPISFRVLILKKGATGEVIRNTPLLHKLRSLSHSWGCNVEITWLTDFVDFVPESFVHRVLKYDWENVQMLLEEEFDLLLSLDKDVHVCALANRIRAKEKKGFLLNKRGRIIPADEDAEEKWLTGVYDDLMRQNEKHYIEEIFKICGWKWTGERYIIEDYIIPELSFQRNSEPLIGLNTGAGSAWQTRIWPENSWAALISKLTKKSYQVLLLGGADEHEKNFRLAKNSGAYYEDVRPLREFVGLVSYCDVVVTAVTMALHIAIALRKKIVLLNNIFNKNEFFLYGLGSVIEPDIPCKACYKQTFDSKCPVPNCMETITTEQVFEAVVRSLQR